MKWYTIRVVSGKEKKTKEAIENELKKNRTEHIISNLLIASQKSVQLRNGKKVHVEKNSFPGYIFVECESINDVEGNIKHLGGISVLKQPLSSSEIERILGNKEDKQESMYVSQRVKIIDGPFSSFVGEIKEIDANKQKAKVCVLIFGRESNLDLTFSQIVKEE